MRRDPRLTAPAGGRVLRGVPVPTSGYDYGWHDDERRPARSRSAPRPVRSSTERAKVKAGRRAARANRRR